MSVVESDAESVSALSDLASGQSVRGSVAGAVTGGLLAGWVLTVVAGHCWTQGRRSVSGYVRIRALANRCDMRM
jgi:hypothetical protein